MADRRIPLGTAVLLASLLALPGVSISASGRSPQERAQTAFARAVNLQTKLMAKPENRRQVSDYQVLILAYHAVYRLDPAFHKTPLALQKIGDLYREMGRLFSRDRYFQSAIQSYQFLMDQYPHASLSQDALLSIGDVYLEDLQNPEEAGKIYREFLNKHPRSDKTAEVAAKLRKTEEAPVEPAISQPAVAESPQAPQSDQMPEVTGIHHWVGPHYTRIVIGLTGEVKFESLRLANPDRIVLDLSSARLSPALAGMKFPMENGFLHQVRVGQFKQDVTRVVLDVDQVQDYFIFSLPNPFRLVIDVHGPESAAAAETAKVKGSEAKPPPAPNAEAAGKLAPVAPSDQTAALSKPAQPLMTAAPSRAGGATASRAVGTAGNNAPPNEEGEVRPARPTQSGAQTLTRALGLKIQRIVIDPGHGGHDTGTIGPTGLMEKEVVLDVALELAKLLREDLGSEVILTRATDTFIPLEERTAVANEKAADLFISIHANASRDSSARGIETYFMNFTSDPQALEVAARENATSQESVHELRDLIKKIALTEKVEESHEFASQVQREFYARMAKIAGKQKNRGVKKAPFVVLIGANMPSILCEIAFLSNPRDERLLKRPEFRQGIAEALYRGVGRYMSNLSGVKVAEQARPAEEASQSTGASGWHPPHPPSDF